MNTNLLVTPVEMGRIDRATIESGIDGFSLMRMAGEAVAARLLECFPGAGRAVVLCGPGNNGGDGYVAAAALRRTGMATKVFTLDDTSKLKGDAALAFASFGGQAWPLSDYVPETGDVVIDALFGAGLDRDIEGIAADCLGHLGRSGVPIVAVDLPSGVSGLSGHVLGVAARACETVTFFARKPGHLLMPGRELCGRVTVADIGIPARMETIASGNLRENGPSVWLDHLPRIDAGSHKYTRGHLGVFSGPKGGTGAGRLSASAGAYAGAGLVTIASSSDALAVNAAHLTSIMIRQVDDIDAVEHWAADGRYTAFVLGPGFGVGETARHYGLALSAKHLVLDADGITSFAQSRDELFAAFTGAPVRLVLTPHSGEFGRLFPDIIEDERTSKVEMTLRAASMSNAVVLFKGSDTVVASPDGRAVINANAPPWLATAGSGDVLSGIIGGLWAQGMPAFEAAAAAAWIHGEAARLLGSGLIADDLPHAVGEVLARLINETRPIEDRL